MTSDFVTLGRNGDEGGPCIVDLVGDLRLCRVAPRTIIILIGHIDEERVGIWPRVQGIKSSFYGPVISLVATTGVETSDGIDRLTAIGCVRLIE